MKLIILVVALGAGAGCKKDQCTESQKDATPSTVAITWKQCSDDKDRRVACEVAGTHWSCTCTLGGAAGRTFQLPFGGTVSDKTLSGKIAKDNCGWAFAP